MDHDESEPPWLNWLILVLLGGPLALVAVGLLVVSTFPKMPGDKEWAAQIEMKDAATGSRWDVVTGKCVAGQLKGKRLRPQPGTISYREAWKTFFPKGELSSPISGWRVWRKRAQSLMIWPSELK